MLELLIKVRKATRESTVGLIFSIRYKKSFRFHCGYQQKMLVLTILRMMQTERKMESKANGIYIGTHKFVPNFRRTKQE